MDLSETYSNNYSIIREYVKGYKPTPVKPTIDPSITDLSYDPNSTVKAITQQRKNLSELDNTFPILGTITLSSRIDPSEDVLSDASVC